MQCRIRPALGTARPCTSQCKQDITELTRVAFNLENRKSKPFLNECSDRIPLGSGLFQFQTRWQQRLFEGHICALSCLLQASVVDCKWWREGGGECVCVCVCVWGGGGIGENGRVLEAICWLVNSFNPLSFTEARCAPAPLPQLSFFLSLSLSLSTASLA